MTDIENFIDLAINQIQNALLSGSRGTRVTEEVTQICDEVVSQLEVGVEEEERAREIATLASNLAVQSTSFAREWPSPSSVKESVLPMLPSIAPQKTGIPARILLVLLNNNEKRLMEEELSLDENTDLRLKYAIAMDENLLVDPSSDTFLQLMNTLLGLDIISFERYTSIYNAIISLHSEGEEEIEQ